MCIDGEQKQVVIDLTTGSTQRKAVSERVVEKVMAKLLTLRQACCHPQVLLTHRYVHLCMLMVVLSVVFKLITRDKAQHKLHHAAPVTMDAVLNKLLEKCKAEAGKTTT